MKRLAFLAIGLSVALSGAPFGSAAHAAAPCRDAKGKFITCPPPPTAKAAKCRDAKGKFTKCTTPATAPS